MPFNHYNPHNPTTLGNEYAPVVAVDYTPEMFVERGYSFRQDIIGSRYRWLSMFVTELPPWPVPGHGYLFTLYRRGQETNTGPMRKLIVPISGAATAAATVVGGGGSATAALQNPTDNSYVRMGVTNGAESYIRASFATQAGTEAEAVLAGKRIVSVSVVYSAFAQPGNESPLPLNLFHRRTSDSIRINMGQLDVPLSASSILATQQQRIGELNSYDDQLGDDPLTEINVRLPWRYSGRGLFDLRATTGNQTMELQIAAATTEGLREIYVQYVALEVTYCEENRIGVVGFVRGADYDATCVISPNGYTLGRNTFCGGLGMANPQNGGATTVLLDTYQGTVTLKRADYGPYNNAGPAPKLRALRTLTPFPDHPGVAINLTGAEGETPTLTVTDLVPQIIMHDPDGPASFFGDDPSYPWGHTYGLQVPLDVYSGQTVVQEIDQYAAAADTPYRWLTFWARSLDASAPLRIEIETQSQGPTTVYSLTPQAWAALPEIADGWRQVTVEVIDDLIADDDGTVLTPAAPRFRSDTAEFRPWQVLAERVDTVAFDSGNPDDTGIGTYGDEAAEGGIEGAFAATADTDVAVYWTVQPDTVTGLAAAIAVQELAPADPDCPGNTTDIPTGLHYVHLTWDALPDAPESAEFGYYELARAVDDDDAQVIARIHHQLITEFNDYEAPIARTLTYTIRYVTATGIGGDQTTAEAIIPSPGVINDHGGACPALVFTSNTAPDTNLAYPIAWAGPVAEEFLFVEADDRVLQQLHRRDYQVAFRPAERGGIQFTRTLMVNAVALPPGPLLEAFTDIRDLAWADLPYVCVRNRYGEIVLANVNVPTGVRRNQRKLSTVEAVITQVTEVPYVVDVIGCEGLTSAAALPGLVYDSRYAVAPPTTLMDGDGTNTITAYAGLRLPFYGQQVVPLAARYDGTDGWAFYFDDGTLGFRIEDGTDDASFASDPVPYDPGTLYWVRFDYDGTGAVATGQFWTAPDTDGAPGTWSTLGTTAVTTDPVTVSFPGLPFTVGAIADGTVDFLGGAVGGAGGWTGTITGAHAEVSGVLVADPAFGDQVPGTVMFYDGVPGPWGPGNEWTVSGGICATGNTSV
jgi:hypothetical protein